MNHKRKKEIFKWNKKRETFDVGIFFTHSHFPSAVCLVSCLPFTAKISTFMNHNTCICIYFLKKRKREQFLLCFKEKQRIDGWMNQVGAAIYDDRMKTFIVQKKTLSFFYSVEGRIFFLPSWCAFNDAMTYSICWVACIYLSTILMRM